MKNSAILAALALVGVSASSAASSLYMRHFDSGFENGGLVLDSNLNPWSDTRTITGLGEVTLGEIAVSLELSGGYNGDLYGYLSFRGTLVPLLNRVGRGTDNDFGYEDAGLNVTFTDRAAHDIHYYQDVPSSGVIGGALWKPDGRTISPITPLSSAFDPPGTVGLDAFLGADPNGDWTLVLADLSGGEQARVVRWGLELRAAAEVAEPGVYATVAALGCLGLAGWGCLRRGHW